MSKKSVNQLKELLKEGSDFYRKTKENLPDNNTSKDCIANLELALVGIACTIIPNGKNSIPKTNTLLQEHGLGNLQITV